MRNSCHQTFCPNAPTFLLLRKYWKKKPIDMNNNMNMIIEELLGTIILLGSFSTLYTAYAIKNRMKIQIENKNAIFIRNKGRVLYNNIDYYNYNDDYYINDNLESTIATEYICCIVKCILSTAFVSK